jgi:Domain of unknown function (DUF5916)/Carbohydrate family 9 binding domain-like
LTPINYQTKVNYSHYFAIIVSFTLYFGLLPHLNAQKINESVQYKIKRAEGEIKIDGNMDDSGWQNTALGSTFWMITPMDTSLTRAQTEFRFTYDDKNLYLVAVCYEAIKDKSYIVESLKRDFNFGKNDNLWLILEPFNDLTNGFVFGANPAGAQFDGMIYDGSELNVNWDNKWISATKYLGDRWIFEAAIPFKTLRYKAGETRWGMNFSRLDIKSNEKSSWAPIPRQFKSITLAYTGVLVWDEAPPTPSNNISIIPYALGAVTKNYEQLEKADTRTAFGVDGKIAVTSSLNLDLTINPDFSQVDVDQQVTNLDRFELFFPERRQFFLENSDLFSSFGTNSVRPFFSRRIGLGVPIQYGVRLSGKLDKNTRLGVLNMQTGAVGAEGRPTQNFSAIALQRKIFSRSNIGLLLLNKQSLQFDTSKHHGFKEYNRNIGLEYNLATKSNYWTGKILALKSLSPNSTGRDMAQTGTLNYASKHWVNSVVFSHVGRDFVAETGYVPRKNFYYVSPSFNYRMYPKSKNSTINYHGPNVFGTLYYNESSLKTDHLIYGNYQINFKNQASMSVWTAQDWIRLSDPFNPLNPFSGAYYIEKGTIHIWQAGGFNFNTTPRKLLNLSFRSRYGGYYTKGRRLNLNTEIAYRLQPFAALSVSVDFNDIRGVTVINSATKLTEKRGNRFVLLNSKLDITFTNKLFWTTYLQYNEQQNNVNLNTRLQWRFKPASDIFLVYTDNYLPETFGLKNRALILKATYWGGL